MAMMEVMDLSIFLAGWVVGALSWAVFGEMAIRKLARHLARH